MGPTLDPAGSCRPQMGPMLAPWTLLSGTLSMFLDPFTVSLHLPVQGDCQWPLTKMWKFPPVTWAHNPLRMRKIQPIFWPTNHKWMMTDIWWLCLVLHWRSLLCESRVVEQFNVYFRRCFGDVTSALNRTKSQAIRLHVEKSVFSLTIKKWSLESDRWITITKG